MATRWRWPPEKLGGALGRVGCELEAFEDRGGSGAGGGGGFPVNLDQGKDDVVEGGEVGEEVVSLEDDADAGAVGAKGGFGRGNGFAVHFDRARVGSGQAGYQAKEGRLAAAGGTDESEHVVEFVATAEMIDHDLVAEGLRDIVELKCHSESDVPASGLPVRW